MKKFPNSTLLVGHDLYAEMAEIKDEFDFLQYPKDHSLQSYDNMKVVGKYSRMNARDI